MKKFHLTEDQVFVNLQNYGNTSAASIPIAIDEAKRAGRMKPGDNVVIVGFGAGLTCGANLIKW
jgi:3-oxoacyl-[acyl-carrier-protein] synthase-3